MEYLQLLFLATVQGITEFLPISSSGHLVVFEALSGHSPDKKLNILLHAGTLMSILFFYWRRILELITRDRRVILLLVVGTIPASVVGLIVHKFFDQVLESPLITGLMFPITGGALCAAHYFKAGKKDYSELTYTEVWLIGIMQMIALLPGISRSGFTIVGCLLVGLKREAAATFAFLLAIPVIAGATFVEVLSMLTSTSTDPLESTASAAGSAESYSNGMLLFAAFVSFLVGLAAIPSLVYVIKQDKLHWFAWWLFPAGIVVVSLCAAGYIKSW
jgi:undecaprenyl-diphosphatase